MSTNPPSLPTTSAALNSRSKATGAVFALAGMSAYYLPVTKDRFVRTAFNIVKNRTENTIDDLNDAALAITNRKLSPEQKVFLSQNGVAETLDAINSKIAELKNSITDSDTVKNLKKGFADNFKDFKKSEALMDSVSSKAFQKIRWRNFAWGAGIGFVLGNFLGSGMKG